MRRLVWLIAAIALSTPCFAQPAPTISPALTSTTSPLTAEQKSLVTSYAKHYATELGGKQADVASAARAKLVAPLNTPGVTPIFRNEFAAAVLPELEPLVKQTADHYAAINALQVAAQLKSTGSMQLAQKYLSVQTEPREAVRLWATIAFREAAVELSGNPINAQAVSSASRSLSRAAKEETDWLVLMRQLQALGMIKNTVAEDEELAVLEIVVDRMAREDGPSDLVHAVFPAIVSLRDRMITNAIPQARLASMGKKLGPILGKVLDTANKNWAEVQDDREARSTYGKLISATERTINIVDRSVQPSAQQPPQTALTEWWVKQDQPKFDRDVKLWQTRLELPAYRAGS